MQDNDSCEKVTYMGDAQGPEKVNNTCVKTMHAVMMARGFTVLASQGLYFLELVYRNYRILAV
jgi:hypothetical protein